MKTILTAAALAALTAGHAGAGPIGKACTKAGRASDPALCACIQQVADRTLTGADQRLAARFFADPARAQSVRQSSKPTARAFWSRYAAFGSTAEAVCAG